MLSASSDLKHSNTKIFKDNFHIFISFSVVAFLVAYNQNKGLIGKNGLLPADQHLKHLEKHTKGNAWNMFTYAPTVIWLLDYENNIDMILEYVALAGMALSVFVFVAGCANIPLMLIIWALYHSIVNVGQRWYSFGKSVKGKSRKVNAL